ncbi:hypothetical protein [Mesoaciditoga lauensis]|uniref:hypothetical protein n=1 Tax=Mesoaciditoga lauensis TaxID=1495039 RepID=UPI00056C6929|nr:hypothetical protein [Mesoaciditoga lauensis]
MRKIVIVIMIATLFLLISFISFGNTKDSNLELKNLSLKTTKLASSLLTYKASYIYSELENGLKNIGNLKKLVNERLNGKNNISDSEILSGAISMFKELHDDYEAIDKNAATIKNGFDNLILQCDEKVNEANDEINVLEGQLSLLKQKLQDAKEKGDTDVINSLKSQISILETRIKMWKYFRDTISSLPVKGKELEKSIEHFLKVVHLSVPVYNQAYLAVSEMKQLKSFLNDVKALSNLDLLSTQIEQSWSDISEIVKSIEEISEMSSSKKPYGTLQFKDLKIQEDGFGDWIRAIEKWVMNLFGFMHPSSPIYTWEDVAKMFKNMNEDLSWVIAKL